MKRLLLGASILAAGVIAAHAGRPAPNWISFSEVTQDLQSAGYSDIREIEADDGYWKAHAMKDGQLFKVVLDPQTGNILSARPKYEDHDED